MSRRGVILWTASYKADSKACSGLQELGLGSLGGQACLVYEFSRLKALAGLVRPDHIQETLHWVNSVF